MVIRFATMGDMYAWIAVAADVAETFGNPEMPRDPEFLDYAQRKIHQREALVAVLGKTRTGGSSDEGKGDVMTDVPRSNGYLGFIGFSRTYNRITWFGVFESQRCRGVGSALLERALGELTAANPLKEITVETYREDYVPGRPARHVYHKFGFRDVDNSIFDHLGNPRCRMVLDSRK